MTKTQLTCLKAASKTGGYAMYAGVQVNAAKGLVKMGLVSIIPNGSLGVVIANSAGIARLSKDH